MRDIVRRGLVFAAGAALAYLEVRYITRLHLRLAQQSHALYTLGEIGRRQSQLWQDAFTAHDQQIACYKTLVASLLLDADPATREAVARQLHLAPATDGRSPFQKKGAL